MTDPLFRQMRGQMTPSQDLLDQLNEKLAHDAAAPESAHSVAARRALATAAPPTAPAGQPGRARQRRTALLAAAAAVVAVGGGVLPMVSGHLGATPSAPVTVPAALPAGSGASADEATVQLPAGTGDYAAVYDAVAAAWDRSYGYYYYTDTVAAGRGADIAVAESGAEAPAKVPAADQAEVAYSSTSGAVDAGGTYSETNVQVAGIDEGDVVKTNGETIFVASGHQVSLLSAAGAATAQVGRIDLAADQPPVTGADGLATVTGDVIDLMLAGDRLVVLVNEYAPDQTPSWTGNYTYIQYAATATKALLYDIADPANPQYLGALSQSGGYTTSRLLGSTLYLVSDYTLPSDPPDPDDPVTFVPLTSEDGAVAEPMPVDCIALFPAAASPRYAVATAIDVTTGTRLAEVSVLGGAETVYMSASNLFLAATTWYGDVAIPDATLTAAGLTADTAGAATHIARLSLDGLGLAAETTVPGYLVNQFALDEYDGYLRVALTVEGYSDTAWSQHASLLVLDAGLQVTGAIASLVEDETIRSVRYSETTVHIVTFRQTDPLFAVDLSDPAHPEIRSALKIPGFSTYLHPWTDGLLLGLGWNADETTGWTDGMKLTMFDVADPFDVREVTTLLVPYYESEALTDHRAVLADLGRGLIGFPVMDWNTLTQSYLVYSYADGAFTAVAALEVPQAAGSGDKYASYYDAAVRGVTVGEDLYVVSAGSVGVYALDGWAALATVTW
jgi:uncharacterized secreted protein with C-terminal beta-propeller domain